ncbi:MAG TPA: hypothetical protein P5107_04135 [Thermotogota bacterium]|nr:hypothetical protein [Thermotogota bacterium]HRW34229.1 hypothetical protein [Thermotogota bacterium]
MKKALISVLFVLLFNTDILAQGPKCIFIFIGGRMGIPQSNTAQILKTMITLFGLINCNL